MYSIFSLRRKLMYLSAALLGLLLATPAADRYIGKDTQRRHGAKEPGLRWGKSAPRVRCDARPMPRIALRAAPAFAEAKLRLRAGRPARKTDLPPSN